jgi:hypothetical protein
MSVIILLGGRVQPLERVARTPVGGLVEGVWSTVEGVGSAVNGTVGSVAGTSCEVAKVLCP